MTSRTKNVVVSKNDSYYSGRYTDPVIPDGYRYAYGTWYDGFVIERIEDGSCFTFIPVGALKDNGTFDGKKFNQRFGRRRWYKEEDNELGEEPIKRMLWNQLQSVREYGGFYISTYQISKSISSKPQSLKGRKPWTCIDFNSAVEIAQHFETTQKLESHLVYGAEYDSILEWFIETDAMSIDAITTLDNHEEDTLLTRWYSTSEEEKKLWVNNVFDLAGNCSEWTQERVKSKYVKAVIRGGSRISSGKRKPMADRNSRSTFIKDPYIGFRIVLSIP